MQGLPSFGYRALGLTAGELQKYNPNVGGYFSMAELHKRVAVALDTLGCKLNQAETELLAKQFVEAGYSLVSTVGEADVYILNTCTVTHIADRKSRHLLRLAHRQNPEALVVATGCYAERAPQELAQTQGVNLVLGNSDKPNLLRLLQNYGYIGSPAVRQGGSITRYENLRTRAFVKVQDGCNSLCSYCIVPLVRGREKSLPLGEVVAEVKRRVAQGYREVVLTGVKIGSYSCDGVNPKGLQGHIANGVSLKDLPEGIPSGVSLKGLRGDIANEVSLKGLRGRIASEVSLKGLLEHILAESGVERLRLSSLQPQEISPELIELWRDRRLCPHFHLCLQSGSDRVLEQMKRRYSTDNFKQAVSLIREAVPEAAITTDVMVGFPGETQAEFEESYNFCREMQFARIHVFSYSRRSGTLASQLPHQIGDRVKKERSQRMLALAQQSAQNFSRRFLGKTMAVLFEKKSDGVWSGLTGNYIKVYTKSSGDLTNKLLPVKLVEVRKDGVWGVVRA